MSTLGIAVIAGTAAAVIYWLGYWHGRRAPLERPRHHSEPFLPRLPAPPPPPPPEDDGHVHRHGPNPCGCVLDIPRTPLPPDLPPDLPGHGPGTYWDTIRDAEIITAERRADRYRLAWLSARRRAHRGQLLAHMLGDCDECGAPPLAPHAIGCHVPMPTLREAGEQ